jgi:hypothetical protein
MLFHSLLDVYQQVHRNMCEFWCPFKKMSWRVKLVVLETGTAMKSYNVYEGLNAFGLIFLLIKVIDMLHHLDTF